MQKKIVEVCQKHISKDQNELSENKLCSWAEVECLGACVNAPMMQINQDYFEDLDVNKTEEIIQKLLEDKFPTPGSAKNRKSTAPEKGKNNFTRCKKMLKDEDRIFKNLYNDLGWHINSAIERGDWTQTKKSYFKRKRMDY